ncbi:MAG: hypothetical protein MZV70_33980 [Desulfobacterales bacterium]|nr:hypothetical protein [Desulfobacterales bacterium]
MSWVGLASNLKRVPDLWIQRAELAMQFKRMEQVLDKRRGRFGDEQIERAKARVAEEYAAFRKALEEWAKVRDQWVADRKQNLLQKWEETSFRLRLKQIEFGLRMQRRRLRDVARVRLTRVRTGSRTRPAAAAACPGSARGSCPRCRACRSGSSP